MALMILADTGIPPDALEVIALIVQLRLPHTEPIPALDNLNDDAEALSPQDKARHFLDWVDEKLAERHFFHHFPGHSETFTDFLLPTPAKFVTANRLSAWQTLFLVWCLGQIHTVAKARVRPSLTYANLFNMTF